MPLLTYFFLGWFGLGLGSSSVSWKCSYVFQPTRILVNRKLPNYNARATMPPPAPPRQKIQSKWKPQVSEAGDCGQERSGVQLGPGVRYPALQDQPRGKLWKQVPGNSFRLSSWWYMVEYTVSNVLSVQPVPAPLSTPVLPVLQSTLCPFSRHEALPCAHCPPVTQHVMPQMPHY